MAERKRRISRRGLLRAGAVVLAAGSPFGLYAWRYEPHWRTTRELAMPLTNLPEKWAGKRIVQLSDLHIGALVDSDYIIESFEAVNAMKPDMVLITGDFMSCWKDEQVEEVARVLKHLKEPPHGVHACLGNHDYGGGWKENWVADALVERLDGVRFLRNESTDMDGLKLIGLDDLWSPNFEPIPALRNARPGEPTICLCHNPDVCDMRVWGDFRGWILSGHTHGGQCKAPFLPPPLLPVNNRKYTKGIFELDENRTLHINPGLGYVRRVRFNVRPEITVFTLVRSA